jgi:hypothetical protein
VANPVTVNRKHNPMKYEITEAQMNELGLILHGLNRLVVVFEDANGSGFLRETRGRLYELVQRIEMQDVEDAT